MDKTLDQLVSGLECPDPSQRSHIVREIGKWRNALAVETLIRILVNDPDLSPRCAAAFALGEQGDQRAIEPLRKCLDENADDLVGSAIRSLGKLKDEASIPRFLSFLDGKNNTWIRVEAIGALCELHHSPALAYFREMLQDADPVVRHEALAGIFTLGNRIQADIKADVVACLSDPVESNRRLAQHMLKAIESG